MECRKLTYKHSPVKIDYVDSFSIFTTGRQSLSLSHKLFNKLYQVVRSTKPNEIKTIVLLRKADPYTGHEDGEAIFVTIDRTSPRMDSRYDTLRIIHFLPCCDGTSYSNRYFLTVQDIFIFVQEYAKVFISLIK